eukprot:UN30417
MGMTLTVPILRHSDTFTMECTDNNLRGDVTVRCWDGEISLLNEGCYTYCDPGLHLVNGFLVSTEELSHGDIHMIGCPKHDFSGNLVLICTDGEIETFLDGCYSNCDGGLYSLSNKGEIINISVPSSIHEEEIIVNCEGEYVGEVEFKCV